MACAVSIRRISTAVDRQVISPVLNTHVSMRWEPFGALLYSFATRRLVVVEDLKLAQVLAELGVHRNLSAAFAAAGVEAGSVVRYRRAIDQLGSVGIVVDSSVSGTQGDVEQQTRHGLPRVCDRRRFRSEALSKGLTAPICLSWELTYACNFACIHCLSNSGRRRPAELSTAEIEALIDELAKMQVFYVNFGGGEPTIRDDFWDLVNYATEHHIGIKFSTNGSRIRPCTASLLRNNDYVDVQVSLDGATSEVNDAVRGEGTFAVAMRAMDCLAAAGVEGFKLSVVVTRHNVTQLDELKAIADQYGAQLRLTRLRPSGRGADVWQALHLTGSQQRMLHDWLLSKGEQVLTGDSFFHLCSLGKALPGLNLCGAGRLVCLIDPVGDVYACPFTIDPYFRAGNVRERAFAQIWADSKSFASLREPQNSQRCRRCPKFADCKGGCIATKFFTGLPLDGPDPECAMSGPDVSEVCSR